MNLIDDARPCHFTFANQVGVQTDESNEIQVSLCAKQLEVICG